MSQGEIDRFPVNQLQGRYGLAARSAVYKRLEDLSIKPTKVGNRAFINAQELQLMDDLHQFIQQGGSAAEFRDMRGMNRRNQSAKPSQNASGLAGLAPDMGILARLLGGMQPQKTLSYLEELEKACQQGWIISTSDLADLLKVTPEEIRQRPKGFSDGSFEFIPVTRLINGEIGWRVQKYRRGNLIL